MTRTGRLIEAWADDVLVESYTYDENDNFAEISRDGSPLGVTVDARDRLLTLGGSVYEHDINGFRTREETAGGQVRTYEHDALGRLLAVDLSDGRRVTYVVDAKGRRIARLVDGAPTRAFIYDGLIRPAAAYDVTGALEWVFAYAENVCRGEPSRSRPRPRPAR